MKATRDHAMGENAAQGSAYFIREPRRVSDLLRPHNGRGIKLSYKLDKKRFDEGSVLFSKEKSCAKKASWRTMLIALSSNFRQSVEIFFGNVLLPARRTDLSDAPDESMLRIWRSALRRT